MPAIVILAASFAIVFVGGGSRFAVGLAFKPMVAELGWSRGQLGLAVGAYFVVTAFASYLAGRIADRASPRLLLNAGVAVSALGIGLMGLVMEPWHALVLYGVLFGLGNGALSLVPIGVVVTRAFPGRAGLVNSVVASGVSSGQLIVIAVLAAALLEVGWRSIFGWLAVAHLALVPLVIAVFPGKAAHRAAAGAAASDGLNVREAAVKPQFWLLLAVYAICGFDDFFVATHVVAFAQDRGVNALFAGNLLALMGLTALIGVLAAGAISDRIGPVWTTAATFVARIMVFGLISINQSTPAIAIFALVFGATFIVTAPLVVLFVRDHFGMAHLGSLTGLITMVHQIFGGIGAYGGARIFDATGSYDAGFILMLAASAIALVLTLLLRAPSRWKQR
jgi:MFS family permease